MHRKILFTLLGLGLIGGNLIHGLIAGNVINISTLVVVGIGLLLIVGSQYGLFGKGDVNVEMNMPPESLVRLQALKQKTLANETVVVSEALRLYEDAINETESGSVFFVKRKGREIEPYEIFEESEEVAN